MGLMLVRQWKSNRKKSLLWYSKFHNAYKITNFWAKKWNNYY